MKIVVHFRTIPELYRVNFTGWFGNEEDDGVDLRDVTNVTWLGMEKQEKQEKQDTQGNPINNEGKLVICEVQSVDEITDLDFVNGERNIGLPKLSDQLADALQTNGRRVVIKRNIFIKNALSHPDLTPSMSRDILRQALYETNIIGATQPIAKPDYRIVVHTGALNSIVVVDLYAGKENIEVVGWRQVDESGWKKMKRQAAREDGQLLILSPITGLAADLSTLPGNLSSVSKDNRKK